MELKKITEDLIRFRTETGNNEEINNCLDYVRNLFGNTVYKSLYRNGLLAPVLLLSNKPGMDFDVLVVGHLDVVPAEDDMFNPVSKDGKMFARGSLDMKSFAAVGFAFFELNKRGKKQSRQIDRRH